MQEPNTSDFDFLYNLKYLPIGSDTLVSAKAPKTNVPLWQVASLFKLIQHCDDSDNRQTSASLHRRRSHDQPAVQSVRPSEVFFRRNYAIPLFTFLCMFFTDSLSTTGKSPARGYFLNCRHASSDIKMPWHRPDRNSMLRKSEILSLPNADTRIGI